MPDTVRLALAAPASAHDVLVAELDDLGFTAYESGPDALVAYAAADTWTPATEEAARALARAHGAPVAVETVPDQNWNAAWEATIQPLAIGPFVIAPTWAEPGPEHAHLSVLRIDPKMAFGTGYHPTTRIVLRLMEGRVAPGARVLDVGTGTGVLAIAALRLGADSALGVDIDPWSVENALDNAALNGVSDRLEIRDGSADDVPEHGFGLVVCNIIRAVLLPMLPALAERAAPGASVLVSGLLATERERALDALAAAGLVVDAEEAEGDWWGAAAHRPAEG